MAAQAANLPDGDRTSSNPNSAALGSYIKAQIDLIAAMKPQSSQAREELCRQVEQTDRLIPSPQFQLAYVAQVENHIGTLLKSQSVPLRLNAGIIITRLAAATQSSQLQDEVVTLCADESPAVALWGVKGAKQLLPSVLSLARGRANQVLTDAILKAVDLHGTSAPIVEDAYRAFNLLTNDTAVQPQALNAGTDSTIRLLEARVERAKIDIVVAPQADLDATLYLSRGEVLAAADAKLRSRAAQALFDLAAVYVQHGVLAQNAEARSQYFSIAQSCGEALIVHARDLKKEDVAAGLRRLARISQEGPNRANQVVAEMLPLVQKLYPDIRKEVPQVQIPAPVAG